MQTYPVDVDPEQVVRWLMAELQAAPSTFRILARRTAEVREIPVRKEFHLGDEERENLSEVATVATLEIAPAHARDGWLLTVVVEDESGPRLADAATSAKGEESIDLGTFYRDFIRPGRGSASVVAEVEGPAGQARVTRLVDSIERNRRHAPGRGRAKART